MSNRLCKPQRCSFGKVFSISPISTQARMKIHGRAGHNIRFKFSIFRKNCSNSRQKDGRNSEFVKGRKRIYEISPERERDREREREKEAQ